MLVPCKCTNAGSVAHHSAKAALCLSIPNLDLASVRADGNM